MSRRVSSNFIVDVKVPIPDNRPAVVRIVRAVACPVITSSATIAKKVIVWGHIRVDIEYVAKLLGHTEPIVMYTFDCPISLCIEHRKAKDNLDTDLAAEVEFQRYDLEMERTMCIYIVGKITVLGFRRKAIISVSSACEVIQENMTRTQEDHHTVPQVPRPLVRRNLGWNSWNRRYQK